MELNNKVINSLMAELDDDEMILAVQMSLDLDTQDNVDTNTKEGLIVQQERIAAQIRLTK